MAGGGSDDDWCLLAGAPAAAGQAPPAPAPAPEAPNDADQPRRRAVVQDPSPAAAQGPVREASGSIERRRGSPPPPLYKPALWGAHVSESRPKQERDSLRSRSKEGRPGSRKHRRWTHSVEIVGALRRAMHKAGENADHVSGDPDNLELEGPGNKEFVPSAFYRLMELEGADGALDAWASAETSRRGGSRPRAAKDQERLDLVRHRRTLRNALGTLWPYLNSDDELKDLVRQLEEAATEAFGEVKGNKAVSDEEVALRWLLSWDKGAFETKSGAPPTAEMVVHGLEPQYRKVVHQLGEVLGLKTESMPLPPEQQSLGDKALCIRPPRSRCGSSCAWRPPFSVAQLLAGA